MKPLWQKKITQIAKHQIRNLLLNSPGIPAKIGQLIDGDATPLSEPQLTGDEARRLIDERCPELASEINFYDPIPKAASLGQVHRALLKSGAEVAIKVQYPDLKQALDSQLDRMIRLAEFSPGGKFGFSAEHYRKYFKGLLAEELDYRHEAQNQIRYFNSSSDQPQIVIPKVYPKFSNQQILTQTFEPSQKLGELLDLPTDKKKQIASQIFNHFTTTLLDHGLVHVDPHTANWGYRVKTGELVLYDFGAILSLDQHLIDAIKSWITATKNDGPEDFLALFGKMEFDVDRLRTIQDRLKLFSETLLLPFLAMNSNLDQLDSVVGAEKWTFRMAGPPWFLSLMRAGWHWSLVFKKLGVSNFELPPRVTPTSKVLRIRVSENHQEKVDLTLPIHSLTEFENLMPEGALAEIQKQNISISEIRSLLRQPNYRFKLDLNSNGQMKTIEIWAQD